MFVWLFHRVSGAALIVLIGIKILSGYFLFNREHKPEWALSFHRQPVLDVLLVVLFAFHSAYGLRTILIDFGYRKEKKLFWAFTLAAAVISLALIILYVIAQ
jgi:succinate dehydrogenase/fumarate reductase cytochrome b subunit